MRVRRAVVEYPKAFPFVKWAGGKRSLLPELLKRVPARFGTYHEPFVGGGALFFALRSDPRFRFDDAELGDLNLELIVAYRTIREEPRAVVRELGKRERYRNTKRCFLDVRAWEPKSDIARTARFIFLNKTCFNGLYRLNRDGGFNVPFAGYKNPVILDEENIHAVSKNLAGVSIMHQGFDVVLARAKKGDLVYFDPPYFPISKTSSFDRYTSTGFGYADHSYLRDVALELKRRGVHVLLSNSGAKPVRELYADGFVVDEVQGARSVAANAERRGAITDLLIR